MYQTKTGFSQNQNYKDPDGELEEELLGGCHGNEVTSYAWFHGALPGDQAEKLLKRNGQFLVRSVSSQSIGECCLSVKLVSKKIVIIVLNIVFKLVYSEKFDIKSRVSYRVPF